jgi:hypothetical protein
LRQNYGSSVVEIELESDVEGAHVGFINKDGNFNSNVGRGIEVVLKTPKSINSLYRNMMDVRVI